VAAQYRFDTFISSILHFVFFWKEEVDEKPFLLTFVPKKTHNSSQFRMDPILTPPKKSQTIDAGARLGQLVGCIEAGGLTIKRLRLVNDSGPVVALEARKAW
jgi:hypothetical protein